MPCNNQWNGDDIALYQNDELIYTFQSSFIDSQKCISLKDVDKTNDTFKLIITGNDNVS